MLFSLNAFALESDIELFQDMKYEKKINEIGFRVLNANKLQNRAMFRYYSERNPLKLKANFRNGTISVNRGVILALEDDDELAAVLAQQIALVQLSNKGSFRGFFFPIQYDLFVPRKCNYLADKRAVDYLVSAGYHPVALIVALNKIYPQTRYDWYAHLPRTTKRMMRVYEYIYTKYPEYLVHNKYLNNTYYQNFLLISAKEREAFKKKVK